MRRKFLTKLRGASLRVLMLASLLSQAACNEKSEDRGRGFVGSEPENAVTPPTRLDVLVECANEAIFPANLPTDIRWQAHRSGSYTTENALENWIIEVRLIQREPRELDGLVLPFDTKSVVGVSIQGSSKADVTAQKVVDAISASCHGQTSDRDGRVYIKARRMALSTNH